MQRYQELRVWNEAHSFLLAVYRVTASLPPAERYGLCSQLRRAALSVPTNIVEGSRRIGRPDFVRFLNLAEASLAEAQYLLVVCRDLGYLGASVTDPLISTAPRISRMLHALRARITAQDIDDHLPSEASGDSRDSAARAAGSTSPSARATDKDDHAAEGEPVVVPPSTRARRACRARSERRR
jgi:four helix bundle protein